MRNINFTKLTKQSVLEKVSQVSIFAAYLNMSDKAIQYCIDTGELICSPLRNDVHPTCGFRYDNKGKLKMKDFAGYFWGDCFDLVAYVISHLYKRTYNINDKHDFIKVLRHITFTFKDIFYGQDKDINLINEINTIVDNIKNTKHIIELVVREWNKKDVEYWRKLGVSLHYLNLNFIYPVDQYYINKNINPEPKYYYNEFDPCYGYNLGQDKHGIYNIKLYFPKRIKGQTKFITNCNHLEGIYNLDREDYDIICITKSTKDRVCLGSNVNRIISSLYGEENIIKIGFINIPHETYRLRQNEYDWLNGKLTNNGIIVSLMDNDKVGKLEAAWLRKNFNIAPIMIPSVYGVKDFAEFVSECNYKDVQNEVINSINRFNKIKNGKRI